MSNYKTSDGSTWLVDLIEFLATGDHLALAKMAERSTYHFTIGYFVHLVKKVGDFCDTKPYSTLQVRLSELLEHKKATEVLESILNKETGDINNLAYIKEQMTSTHDRLLFWQALIVKHEPIRTGLLAAKPLDGVRREWAYQAIIESPEHQRRQRIMLKHGCDQQMLDEAHEHVWSRFKNWLGRRDVDFYNAIMDDPKALDRLSADQFNTLTDRFSIDIRAASASPGCINRYIQMYTEGVLRGFLEVTPPTLHYGWFLASDKPNKHPSVAETIEQSFTRLAQSELKDLPALLRLLSNYPAFHKVLPACEARPDFGRSLKKLSVEEAGKIIEKSSMRNQWLRRYPELAEDVLTRSLGL